MPTKDIQPGEEMMARRKPRPNTHAVIRELLSKEPSEKIWKLLLDATLKVDPEEWKQTIEPWLLAHLDNAWPDEMRTMLPGWTRRMNMGKRPQGISLIATINWGGRISRPKLKKRLEGAEMPSLRHFNCPFSDASAAGVQYLLSLPCLQNLQTLDLSGNEFGVRGLCHLFSSEVVRKLKHLKLNQMQFTMDEAELFVEMATFDSLESLDLMNDNINTAILGKLAESTMVRNVRELRLDNEMEGWFQNELTLDFLEVFEKYEFSRLEYLDVRENHIYERYERGRKRKRKACPLNDVSPTSIAPNLRDFKW